LQRSLFDFCNADSSGYKLKALAKKVLKFPFFRRGQILIFKVAFDWTSKKIFMEYSADLDS
jgi:hypothetical protein